MKHLLQYMLCALLLGIFPIRSMAQMNVKVIAANYMKFISGRVHTTDEENGTGVKYLPQATVQLFTLPDTTFVTGATTNEKGAYDIEYFGDASYTLLRVSYIGMETFEKRIKSVPTQQIDQAGNPLQQNDSIVLHPKALTMEEVKVVAELKKMYMSGDTLVYNTDAYEVSEGAVLMELVRKLPGIYMKEGRLMYQDKPIQEIKLNGASFFSHDMSIALQNMPVSELEQLKVYEERTKEDQETGLDSGERRTVMDMKTKRDIVSVQFANLSAGATTKEQRYQLGGDAQGYVRDVGEYALKGNMKNLPQYSALNVEKNAGIYGKVNIKKTEASGEVNHQYTKQQQEATSRSGTYLSSYNQYTDTWAQSENSRNQLGGKANVRGKLSEQVGFTFSGNVERTRTNSLSDSQSASFSASPYDLTDDPLRNDAEVPDSYKLNRNENQTLSASEKKEANLNLSLYHYQREKQRGFTWKARGTYNRTDGDQFNRSSTRYYQLGDSIDRRNEYLLLPDQQRNFSTSLTWQTKIFANVSAEFSYGWDWTEDLSERNLFDIGTLMEDEEPLGTLPAAFAQNKVDSLSSNSSDRSSKHTFSLVLHTPYGKPFYLWASIDFFTQRRHVSTLRDHTVADTTAHFIGFNPRFSVDYTTKRKGKISLHYTGTTQAPNASDLLPIVNNDDPLYIRLGNPSLKQAYQQSVNLNYRGSVLNGGIAFFNTLNQVTRKVTYNEQTGGYISRPENINGNWSLRTNGSFNKYWGDFNLMTNLAYNYTNQVGYLNYSSSASEADASKRTMKENQLSGLLTLRYQTPRMDYSLEQGYDFRHSADDSSEQKTITRDYTTRGEITCRLPGSVTLQSDAILRLRDGYALEEANHSELIWNISAKYSFLKGKRANIEVKFFDLLKRQRNTDRSITAFGYSESNTRRLNSYGLITFSYKFSLLQ